MHDKNIPLIIKVGFLTTGFKSVKDTKTLSWVCNDFRAF